MTAQSTAPLAVVTGASRGIGRAIAERLLRDGWSVHGTYRTGEQEAAALTSDYANCSMQRVDVAVDADIDELLAQLAGRPIGALVNNAGVIHFEDMSRFELDRWRHTLEVNLTAPVRLARALEAQLAGGAVVNVASTDAATGAYNSMAYAASKAALLSATKSLGNLLARSAIRVNAVSPGWIATEMTLEEEAAVSLTPLGRLGAPEDVAAAVAWLLSAEASFVTGADLVIDGGYGNVDYVTKLEADAATETT